MDKMNEIDVLKTGTTTVGLVCKDGIVLAADKRATAGYLLANKKTQKIFPIADNMAVTMAGTVSDAQLLVKLIKAEITLKGLRTGRPPNVKESANLLGSMIYSNIRKFSTIPGVAHFLLGGVDQVGFHLYDLYADGSVTEETEFVSSGSGSVMAYGVLETLFRNDLTVKEGVALAIKCVNAAIQRDIASGNGVDIITVTKEGVKHILSKEIDTTIKI
jgi:proteasome beta subunit